MQLLHLQLRKSIQSMPAGQKMGLVCLQLCQMIAQVDAALHLHGLEKFYQVCPFWSLLGAVSAAPGLIRVDLGKFMRLQLMPGSCNSRWARGMCIYVSAQD